MNTELLITQLCKLGNEGMAESFNALCKQSLHTRPSLEMAMAKMLEAEVRHRDEKRTAKLLKKSKLRQTVYLDDIKCSVERNLTNDMLEQLGDCSFVKNGESVIITGKTGCGKTYLACALGHQACMLGLKVLYLSMNHFPDDFALAKLKGTQSKLLASIEKMDLVIIDDFGLQKISEDVRQALFTIIDDRHCRKGTIVTSQLSMETWYTYLGEPTVADAMISRLMRPMHLIELKGEDMRPNATRKR